MQQGSAGAELYDVRWRFMDSVGSRIRSSRKAKRLTQARLGELVRVDGEPVSSQAVSQWESNKRLPQTDTIIEIARVLDVSVDFLLTGTRTGDQNRNTGQLHARGYAVPLVASAHLYDIAGAIDASEDVVTSPWPADFSTTVSDASNEPALAPGDLAFWSMSHAPSPGVLVACMYGSPPRCVIGRYRQEATPAGIVTLVVPMNTDYPAARSDLNDVHVVGVLVGSYRKHGP